jgi:hypothetical protein
MIYDLSFIIHYLLSIVHCLVSRFQGRTVGAIDEDWAIAVGAAAGP